MTWLLEEEVLDPPRSGEAGEGKLSQAFWEGGAWFPACFSLALAGKVPWKVGVHVKREEMVYFFFFVKKQECYKKGYSFYFYQENKNPTYSHSWRSSADPYE